MSEQTPSRRADDEAPSDLRAAFTDIDFPPHELDPYDVLSRGLRRARRRRVLTAGTGVAGVVAVVAAAALAMPLFSRPAPDAPAVPPAATTSVSAPTASSGARGVSLRTPGGRPVQVVLGGTPAAPTVRLVSDAARGGQLLARDTTLSVPGRTVFAFRHADTTVLLVPLGTDQSRDISAFVGVAGRSIPAQTTGEGSVGGSRFAVQVVTGALRPQDLLAVYHESGDGNGGWGDYASSSGDTPVHTSFDSQLMSPHVAYFPKDGMLIVKVADVLAAARVSSVPFWSSPDAPMGGEHDFVALLPAGARDVTAPDQPSVKPLVQTAGPYVVALVEAPTARPGRLSWTDAAGATHVLEPTGAATRAR